MINTETVLVLGAGASADYKFPTGQALRRMIIGQLTPDDNPPSPLTVQLYRLDFSQRQLREFRTALQRSATGSIDEFLESRPEFIEAGKIAIAYTLIQLETDDLLYSDSGWYSYFFRRLTLDCN